MLASQSWLEDDGRIDFCVEKTAESNMGVLRERTENTGDEALVVIDFRERAAIFNHTVGGALSPPHTSRAPGFGTQDHAQARDSNAARPL